MLDERLINMNMLSIKNELKNTLSCYEKNKEKDFNKFNVFQAAKRVGLNSQLAVNQGISVQDIEVLNKLHIYLENVLMFSKKIDVSNKSTLQDIGNHVENIEYIMQDFWGFNRSSAHHTHWTKITHCNCERNNTNPYQDVNWGKEKVRDLKCPVHSIEDNNVLKLDK
jgi:hypothetical protein